MTCTCPAAAELDQARSEIARTLSMYERLHHRHRALQRQLRDALHDHDTRTDLPSPYELRNPQESTT